MYLSTDQEGRTASAPTTQHVHHPNSTISREPVAPTPPWLATRVSVLLWSTMERSVGLCFSTGYVHLSTWCVYFCPNYCFLCVVSAAAVCHSPTVSFIPVLYVYFTATLYFCAVCMYIRSTYPHCWTHLYTAINLPLCQLFGMCC